MTLPPIARACFSPPAVLLTAALLTLPLSATAQQEVAIAPAAVSATLIEPSEFDPALPVRLEIGDSTRSLLQLQREGSAASPTPRPLAGDVASLSYQRYLESFKYPIPEKFNTTVGKSGSNGGNK